MKKPVIRCSEAPVIEPRKGSEWADTMVLNPAIVKDPDSDLIHMLFRATGPWHEKNLRGLSDPYPIFLGYACSRDKGETWEVDYSRPALAPALEYEKDKMYIRDINGNQVINYANGCLEDPRIIVLENRCYLTAAGRMFPPGPYWEGDKRRDNLPDWVLEADQPFGPAAVRNDTATVLFEIDLKQLADRNYEQAFQYVCCLTDANLTDNRDVFLFPEKLKIDGREQYVMLHRPELPDLYSCGQGVYKPSIFIAAADRLEDFAGPAVTHQLLAAEQFDWEEERIGASFPPLKIAPGEWLISYHGKQLPDYGYTQSFMIVREQPTGFPVITNRCPKRLLYARQAWELPDKFLCPCIFTTGGILLDDELIMSYGAADQKIGMAWAYFDEIVDYIRTFDAEGNEIT